MEMDLPPGEHRIGRIPVRNLWLLMLYASDLTRFTGAFNALVDHGVNDLPDLLAHLLTGAVELRLKRNLTRGYRHRQRPLTRVRGRIDALETEARLLLSKGEVFCRYEELTIDTPRNRLVRAALELMVRLVRSEEIRSRCRSLASNFSRAGVSGLRPSPAEFAHNQMGRNDSEDRFMVALALLAFDLALPTQDCGATALVDCEREEIWVRRLFEKAVLGFARVELEPLGWTVRGGIPLQWQVSAASGGLASILPRMITDIVLDPPPPGRRVLIDTKFSSVLTLGRFGNSGLRSEYLYQMYSYIRSQEGADARWKGCAGLFLHPAIEASIDEHAVIQNHSIRFVTVDLLRAPSEIRDELRGILRQSLKVEPQRGRAS